MTVITAAGDARYCDPKAESHLWHLSREIVFVGSHGTLIPPRIPLSLLERQLIAGDKNVARSEAGIDGAHLLETAAGRVLIWSALCAAFQIGKTETVSRVQPATGASPGPSKGFAAIRSIPRSRPNDVNYWLLRTISSKASGASALLKFKLSPLADLSSTKSRFWFLLTR